MSEKNFYDVLPPESSRRILTEEKFFADSAPVYFDSTNGDDSLTGTAGADTFVYKGGNDTIINYSGEDTVSIASGKISTYSFNDDGDLIFNVSNGGTITLQYMQGRAITVKDSAGTSTEIYGTGYSGHDAIKNMVKAWNKTFLPNQSTAKLDESIRLCSHFDTIQEVIDQMVADRKSCSSGDEFLRKYCGIVTDNEDSGAITGWDAGGLSMISAEDIVPETLSTLKHLSSYTDSAFTTKQGVNVNITNKSSNVTDTGKKILDGLYSWWADESFDLIERSFGVKFEEGTNVSFSVTPSGSYWGVTSGMKVSINSGSTYFNGTNDYTGNGVDMTIAHEFTHVAQNLFMGYFPQFLHEGFADLGVGQDNRLNKRDNLISVANNADSLATYLDVSTNGTGNVNYYVAGFMFYRYLARQASINYDSSKKYAWSDGANITGTADADILSASGSNSTVTGGAGNDSLFSYGDKEKVFGGDDNDSLGNSGTSNTLDAGAGNDSINNKGANASIFGGADNDVISGYKDGEGSTLLGGDGKDTVYNYAEKILADGGADADYIYNSADGEGSTLLGGDDKDTIYNYAEKISLDGGAGNDSIYNSADGVNGTISGGNGSDSINNRASNVTVFGGGDSDIIWNYGSSVSVDGGAGVDQIQNYEDATHSTLTGGEGEDVFFNDAAQVTIDGGRDNDWIQNKGAKVSINGGAGGNYIDNYGENVTVKAGAGNDTVYNHAANLYVEYGGGYDYISGADSTTTLKITGSYTSVASGSDLILTVGSYKITVAGAKDKGVTIDDGSVINTWRLNGTTATYGTATNKLITITGVKSIDGITMSGREVTLPQAALGSSNITINDGYTLALGDDVTVPVASITLTAKSKTAATLNEATTAGYVVSSDKKSITLQTAKSGSKVATISGLKSGFSTSDITVDASAKTVTLSANALGTSKVSIDKKGTYSLKLAAGLSPVTYSPSWSIKNTSATLQRVTGAGYTLAEDGKSIAYSKAKALNLATVSGLKKNSSESDLSLSGTTITLSENALGTSNVKVTKGYTLALASGVATAPSAAASDWTVKGTKATYDSITPAYYTANGSTITYHKPITKNLSTVTGLKNGATKDDISLSGTTITLSANALGTSNVKATNGYTFALANGVATAPSTTAAWTVSKGKGTYKGTTSAYYTLANDEKSVKYTKEKSGVTLATITNLNTAAAKDDITVSGNTIILAENALSTNVKKSVKLTTKENYKFSIDSSLTSGTQKYLWMQDTKTKTTAVYGYGTTGHYTLADKTITYTAATIPSATQSIWISNLNAKNLTPDANGKIDGITMSGATITLGNKVLNKKEVKLIGAVAASYHLALASDVTEKSTVGAAAWKHSGSTDTLAEKRSKGYYTNGNYTIGYANKETSMTLATVKGTKRALTSDNYDAATNTVTLSNDCLAANHKVTIGGTTKFNFASDYSKASITGSAAADTLTVAGANITVKAGKGDDVIDLGTAGGNKVFFASGEGNDVIANFDTSDKLIVTSGTVTAADSGDDVIVTVKKGKNTETLTLQDAASETFTIWKKDDDKTSSVLATHTAVSADLATSADLLYDTNIDTAAQLGDLVNNAADYSLGKFETFNATALTQDKTQLTYGTKK